MRRVCLTWYAWARSKPSADRPMPPAPGGTGHASQRIGCQARGRTFAYYLDDDHGDGRVALCCKVPLGDQEALIDLDPERFFRPAYLGVKGWVSVRLDLHTVDWDEV